MQVGKAGKERKGNHYNINANKVKAIEQWIEQFRTILQTQFNELDKVLVALKKQKK